MSTKRQAVEYIESHRSAKGGFTKKAIESMGERWPPIKGWKKRIVKRMSFKPKPKPPTAAQINYLASHGHDRRRVSKWTSLKVLEEISRHVEIHKANQREFDEQIKEAK